VEIAGRLYVNTYKNMDGAPKASLNCHVNHIKIHHSTKRNVATEQATATTAGDDLPF
jgi:hypothetical protein